MLNRIIKFRVWDVSKQAMCYDVDVHSRKPVTYVSIKNYDDNCKDEKRLDLKENDKSHFLMQFTGLYDKNGNEIWEGDILECVTVKSLFKVKYDKDVGSFAAYGITNRGDYDYFHYTVCGRCLGGAQFSVIGNIFENPELVMKKLDGDIMDDRDMKFRVWDKKRNRMLFPKSITFFDDGSWESHNTFNKQVVTEKNGVVMQFTGLHDKNEEKIWEGDIIDYLGYSVVRFGDIFVQCTDCQQCEYCEKCKQVRNFEEFRGWYFYNFKFNSNSGLRDENAKETEVLGNLYENPELIENAAD